MSELLTARILITCPDQPGIVSAVATFLYNHGANIMELDQYSTDPINGTFFMRLEFQTPHLDVSCQVLEKSFANTVANRYQMQWCIHYTTQLKTMAIFASRDDHALLELLWRWSRRELSAHLAFVISNHADLEPMVAAFNIPFYFMEVNANNKTTVEAQMIEMLLQQKVDVVVLARYMQILSPAFVDQFPHRIINIHHSFLPSFVGAHPYKQAYERGVKLIGATAHFVTNELDEGPIIEQDLLRVSHRETVNTLKELGRDIERTVLARAVKWYLEDRIIVYNNKTVVF